MRCFIEAALIGHRDKSDLNAGHDNRVYLQLAYLSNTGSGIRSPSLLRKCRFVLFCCTQLLHTWYVGGLVDGCFRGIEVFAGRKFIANGMKF